MKVLIVDDESPARSRLRSLFESHPDVEVVGEATNGLEALQAVDELDPDAVFLDIEMPELDGLGTAEALKSDGPAVVFVTAYTQHAVRAFEVSAVDYLVKPVASDRMAEALERLRGRKGPPPGGDLNRLAHNLSPDVANRRMAVKCGSKYVVFNPSQVSAMVAKDHYVSILLGERELLADNSLDDLVTRLDPRRFLRVHRSALMNLDFLTELENEGDRKYTAVLSDARKTKLPVSRERLEELKKRLGLEG